MADSNFPSYRRDAPGRNAGSADRTSDPLAELARLIGQNDPHGGASRDQSGAQNRQQGFDDGAGAAQSNRAPGPAGFAEQDSGYAPPPPGQGHWPPAASRPPQQSDYDDQTPPPPPGPYLRPPRSENASQDGHGTAPLGDGHGGLGPPVSAPRDPSLSYLIPEDNGQPPLPPPHSDGYGPDDYAGEGAPPPARRNGTVVLLAVLGLAVAGTAGALGYRAVFGSSALPSLPPIIKPSDGPIKIVPHHEAQNNGASPASATGQGTGERVVARQEQPVSLPPANPTPRVVATIPVAPNGAGEAEPENTLPGVIPPQGTAPAAGNANPGGAAALVGGMPALPEHATPGSPNARQVHTVTIHAGATDSGYAGGGQPAVVPTPKPQPRARSAKPSGAVHQARQQAPRAHRHVVQHAARLRAGEAPRRRRREVARALRPGTQAAGSAAPLSIIPSQVQERVSQRQPLPAPPRYGAANSAPMALAPVPPERVASRGYAPREVAGGRYAVQVSSRRSETEARAAFRSLQARFPQQLGGRHLIIRRADLGSRGVYYRAMVGPFGSANAAAVLCNSLKSAGGSCIVQRD